MPDTSDSFDRLIAPLGAQQFFEQYYDRRWLHQQGDADRFAELMSWDALNRILSMNVWTQRTMEMSLDRQKLPPQAYCEPAMDRNHQQVLRPSKARVMDLVRRGASLVLNEVETLHPPIRGIVGAIETALGARASANVYCSWQHHQAFDSHFDRHDVFALQVLGEKRWNIYAGRAEHPIEHAMFHNVPQATYDQMKGQVAKQVTMRPGDLIYLPRGQFHDAIATDAASIHVTFSATAPNGLDWLTQLWNEAVALPEFRAYLPRVEGSQDQETMRLHLQGLLQKLSQAALSPEAVARITDMRRNYRMLPPTFDLPDGSDRG